MTHTTLVSEATSPGVRLARAQLVALIQQQVVRVAALRAQLSAGLPVTGDLAAELHELELLQDRLDLPGEAR
ncbi:hypothetical protein DVA67_004705 [Solirubrobacter sp. CPCC 204708]|uniref:Uncharacterized protein n=1 Tax=Solirubrobacter deserti TaxID=2282478 RepID=A0ABT4RHW7_9ACTN|nr:hypothetical protein [Solirubrobacter deserti]MBE2315262.1 hypothetical protein [Solirubrobacter deserti]MDA0137946.1 hypothetical protein [Solirubrobacter deserti]